MGSIRVHGRKPPSAKKLENFRRMIKVYDDLLFGISLLSDGMAAYYRDQPNIFTLNEKTFREIKQRIDEAIVHAQDLLQNIKDDKKAIAEISQFEFPSFTDHPLIERIIEQAQILVGVYERMFPDRSRSKPLSHDKLISLMAEALEQFELLKTAERLSPFRKEIN